LKIYEELEQGTPEWLAVRSGKFTASKDFQQLVTGKPETLQKLIRLKAAERITGQLVASTYTNVNMERGKELEASAIEAFEMQTGLAVQRVGFVELSEWAGCSPDGLIGDDAGIEIKSRDIHTHLDCFIDGYDTAYKWQIQGNLYVTGRKRWYFVSYNPFYSHLGKHLFIAKIERDEAIISQIASGIEKGILQVQAVAKIISSQKI
jgi:hypothetical protein